MRYIDRYFYKPSFFQKLLAYILLPISGIYCLASIFRRKFSLKKDFNLPIISVGNLVAGGSGKTPFIIEIAKDYQNVAVVLRGYKRKSKGMLVVSHDGKVMLSQNDSGDEAFLIASRLKNATVIVSKDRKKAIEKAKNMGCKVVFLDDGFRFNFKKLNIVLKPKLEPYFNFCIPSGIYRERKGLYKTADILATESIDYKREVKIINPTERMLLVTAIANPSRLDEYLPNIVGKIMLSDHSEFDLSFLTKQVQKYNATSLLVTQKDEVKLQDCLINLSIMKLDLDISSNIKKTINDYINSYKH